MSKKNSKDALDVLQILQKDVFSKRPSQTIMWDEVRMMKFKIRPLYGDVSSINLKNNNLIEIMWSLGKLDEFFHKEYNKLDNKQKDVFFRIFENLHEQFQTQLNSVNLKSGLSDKTVPVLEMEIYKEKPINKSKLN